MTKISIKKVFGKRRTAGSGTSGSGGGGTGSDAIKSSVSSGQYSETESETNAIHDSGTNGTGKHVQGGVGSGGSTGGSKMSSSSGVSANHVDKVSPSTSSSGPTVSSKSTSAKAKKVTTVPMPNSVNLAAGNKPNSGSIFATGKAAPQPSQQSQQPSLVPTLRPGKDSSFRKSQTDGVVVSNPEADRAYESIPWLEVIELPRGGVSIETQAVGHVQFGIPPETIKDSMRLGIAVPSVYIVPFDRFCRDMGPALGVNLAEFEFPAYFNFFVQRKRCTLIVDSVEAERNIRRVFSETLLGPAQFRREEDPLAYEEEDFAPDFPRDAIPNFQKELKHFRIMPNGEELVLETLLNFCHFEPATDATLRDGLGKPPVGGFDSQNSEVSDGSDENRPAQHMAENGVKKTKSLSYSQIRWIGDVATIYPSDAPEDQIALNKTKRVEVFKMPSGTDYVVHDIDENNIIIGKARFSGNVRVSEGISVIGLDEDDRIKESDSESPSPTILPPTFYPPSFGLTVLGNSHGFDKSGSTSGYVLWINGRGVMIDPPPYSSATLEREGIRPRTIVGIILTHCHADHDAGAFQKVLTGSPVVVVTTPTIYKSFIRKYSALSSLSPALLRHSHRYKPAIIGEPLRFQGATFHFTYTLHSIPCVGFRVDWRGRSMVFTGDHFNNPPVIQKLQESGVLSKSRAADLNHFPLQETDLLLHEAGVPPLHTPLDVLMKFPQEVKNRLYVVHTSALPEGCELRVAPTGTAGTIRLDRIRRGSSFSSTSHKKRPSIFESHHHTSTLPIPSIKNDSPLEDLDEYAESELFTPSAQIVYAHLLGEGNIIRTKPSEPPPVSLRPTSSSDAWFILNLLSAVPFINSLSYTPTMEVLEAARVVAHCCNETVVPANRRSDYLLVVWEGTCMEREVAGGKNRNMIYSKQSSRASNDSLTELLSNEEVKQGKNCAVWHAGDWTGPRSLQPEKRLSGDSSSSVKYDIVAMSEEGVKVIKVDFANLHTILKNGSALYRKYLLSLSQKHTCTIPPSVQGKTYSMFESSVKNLNVIELLDINTGLRKLTAVQKRHLECLVEGPTVYAPGERLWRVGSVVDKAFIVVAGTVAFVPKRRNAGSAAGVATKRKNRKDKNHEATNVEFFQPSIGEKMHTDAVKAIRQLNAKVQSNDSESDSESEALSNDNKPASLTGDNNSLTETDDYARLSRGLRKWAERHEGQTPQEKRRGSSSTDASPDVSLHDFCDTTTVQDDGIERIKSMENSEKKEKNPVKEDLGNSSMSEMSVRRQSKDRFANKVLGRLYNRRAYASGLVFSRGHFLGDIEKMVEGILSSANEGDFIQGNDDGMGQYGFGENDDALSLETMTIHEQEGAQQTAHTSTLAAGKDGCVVLVLPKASLIPFLDEHPGLLLSLLGTQVVV